jgi:hypothetical protein
MKKFSEWIEPIREAQVNEASELQKSYQDYFKAKLKKYNAESPADLDDETKKKFFNEITQEWERGQGVKPEVKEKIEKEEKEAEEKEKKEPASDVTELDGSTADKMKDLTKAK